MGFMGSGKTSLGKKLARKLNFEFLDLDHEIENSDGLSVSEIFKEKGEMYFRDLEFKILQTFQNKKDTVIALGGGTACNDENLEFILNSGTTVYLQMTEDKLLGRLRQKRVKRPLIASLTDEELKRFIHEKLFEREKYYSKADLIYEVNGKKVESLVKALNSID